MKPEVQEIMALSLLPQLEAVALLNPIVGLVCEKCAMPKDKKYNVLIAVEEIFSYCVKILSKRKSGSRIRILFCRDSKALHIIIEHEGPIGELERTLTSGFKKAIKRTSFEAMGLYLARESVDLLYFVMVPGGRNRFTLSKQFMEKE